MNPADMTPSQAREAAAVAQQEAEAKATADATEQAEAMLELGEAFALYATACRDSDWNDAEKADSFWNGLDQLHQAMGFVLEQRKALPAAGGSNG